MGTLAVKNNISVFLQETCVVSAVRLLQDSAGLCRTTWGLFTYWTQHSSSHLHHTSLPIRSDAYSYREGQTPFLWNWYHHMCLFLVVGVSVLLCCHASVKRSNRSNCAAGLPLPYLNPILFFDFSSSAAGKLTTGFLHITYFGSSLCRRRHQCLYHQKNIWAFFKVMERKDENPLRCEQKESAAWEHLDFPSGLWWVCVKPQGSGPDV